MSQQDQVIEEVDQKLEGQVGARVSSIYHALATTNKEVNQLFKRASNNQQSNNFSSSRFYGKKYRFQQREEELKIQTPKMERSCVTQNIKQQIEIDRLSHHQKPKKKKEEDESIYMNNDIRLPSHQYYIYFDKPEKIKGKKPSLKVQSKPEWFLEKKISNLEKQVKKLKENEKNNSFMNSKQFRKTDGPIHLKNNLERMVETLWK